MNARPYIVLSLFGRCGSMFLHSLFDGHPALSTIPGIAPYNLLSDLIRRNGNTQDLPAVIEYVSQNFAAVFNNPFLRHDAGLDRLGEQGNEVLDLDPAVFRRNFAERLAAWGRADLLAVCEAMHDAFDLSFGREPRERIFLELHTILPGDSEAVLATLPQAQSLFLARHPVDDVESCVNYLLLRKPVQRNRLTKFYQLVLGMLAFQAGQSFLDEKALALRFEDLKSQPESFMRRVSERIGIDFDPVLLESTYMGKRYHSAPTQRNPGISGFQQLQQVPSGYRLTEHDRRFFAALFGGIADFMHYETGPRASSAEVEAVLTRHALDVEVQIAKQIGMDLSTFGSQQDVVGFRQQLAKLLSSSGTAPCGLRCTRLDMDGG